MTTPLKRSLFNDTEFVVCLFVCLLVGLFVCLFVRFLSQIAVFETSRKQAPADANFASVTQENVFESNQKHFCFKDKISVKRQTEETG